MIDYIDINEIVVSNKISFGEVSEYRRDFDKTKCMFLL